jgi:hypothetical protein
MHTRDGVSRFVGLWCDEREVPEDVEDDDLVWVQAAHVVSIGRANGRTIVGLTHGVIHTATATPDEVRWAVDYVLARVDRSGTLAVDGVSASRGVDGEAVMTTVDRQKTGESRVY